MDNNIEQIENKQNTIKKSKFNSIEEMKRVLLSSRLERNRQKTIVQEKKDDLLLEERHLHYLQKRANKLNDLYYHYKDKKELF